MHLKNSSSNLTWHMLFGDPLAGLFVFMSLVLFVVRWNVVNGKAGALGFVAASVNTALMAFNLDGGKFVPRGWCVASFILAFFFGIKNSNSVP